MKTLSTLFLLIYLSQNTFGQQFIRSKSYSLSEIKRIDKELLEYKNVDDAIIYLEDAKQRKMERPFMAIKITQK